MNKLLKINQIRTWSLLSRSFSTQVPREKVNTDFIDPIEDFNFDTEFFSELAIKMAAQKKFDEKEVIIAKNQLLIRKLQNMAGSQ